MKLAMIIALGFVIACKPQEKNSQDIDLPSAETYSPNPDEIVLLLNNPNASGVKDQYDVEVVRQLRAGSGFKSRLSKGQAITLISNIEIPHGEFYCAVEYQISPDGGTYQLKSLLKE